MSTTKRNWKRNYAGIGKDGKPYHFGGWTTTVTEAAIKIFAHRQENGRWFGRCEVNGKVHTEINDTREKVLIDLLCSVLFRG